MMFNMPKFRVPVEVYPLAVFVSSAVVAGITMCGISLDRQLKLNKAMNTTPAVIKN